MPAPIIEEASFNNKTLSLKFDTDLFSESLPTAKSFTVKLDGRVVKIAKGSDKKDLIALDTNDRSLLKITLEEEPLQGQALVITYRDKSIANDTIDVLQNAEDRIDVATFSLPIDTSEGTPRPKLADDGLAIVNERELTLTFDTDLDGTGVGAKSFIVRANGQVLRTSKIDGVAVKDKVVTLKLDDPILSGQQVSVEYKDKSSKDDPNGVLQTKTASTGTGTSSGGVDVASFVTTLKAEIDDIAPPKLADTDAMIIGEDGRTLTLTFDQPLDKDTLPDAKAFTVKAAGSAVLRIGDLTAPTDTTKAIALGTDPTTLVIKLLDPIAKDQLVSLTYKDPKATDDTAKVLQSVFNKDKKTGGIDVATFSVSAEATDVDVEIPALAESDSAVMENSKTIKLTFSSDLDITTLPTSKGFSVIVNNQTVKVTEVKKGASDAEILVGLEKHVVKGDQVGISYKDPSAKDDIKNVLQHKENKIDVASFNHWVVNNDLDSSRPGIKESEMQPFTATTNSKIKLTFDSDIDVTALTNPTLAKAFTVKIDNKNIKLAASNPITADGSDAIILTLDQKVASGQKVSVSYKDPSVKDDEALQAPKVGSGATQTGGEDVLSFVTAVKNSSEDESQKQPVLSSFLIKDYVAPPQPADDTGTTGTGTTGTGTGTTGTGTTGTGTTGTGTTGTTTTTPDANHTATATLDLVFNQELNNTTLNLKNFQVKVAGKAATIKESTISENTLTLKLEWDVKKLKIDSKTFDINQSLSFSYKDPKPTDDTTGVLEGKENGLDVGSISHSLLFGVATGTKGHDLFCVNPDAETPVTEFTGGKGNDLILTNGETLTINFANSASENGVDQIVGFSGGKLKFGTFVSGGLGTTDAKPIPEGTTEIDISGKVALVKADSSVITTNDVSSWFGKKETFKDLADKSNAVVLVGEGSSDVNIYYVTGSSKGIEKVSLVGVMLGSSIDDFDTSMF